MAKKHYIIAPSKTIQLPVPPSSYTIVSGQNVSTINLIGFGEMINGSTPKLKTWSISKYFPHQNYGFISDSELMDPWDYVDFFEDLKANGTEIGYMISDTNIYIPCIIEDFQYGESDGSGDVNYTLSFRENKSTNLTSKDGVKLNSGYVPENNSGNYYWIVKEEDTVLKICKKAYGDSSKFKELLKKNNLKNPSQVKVGTVLQL